MQISAAQWARLDPDNAEPWLAAPRRRAGARTAPRSTTRCSTSPPPSAIRRLGAARGDRRRSRRTDERSLLGTYHGDRQRSASM
jgi:hypothetical protein